MDESKELSFDEMIEKTARFKDRYRGVKPLFDPISYLDYTHSTGEMYGENYVLTGNSTGFIDPIFSSGVAIATESGLKAAKLVDKVLSGNTVDWKKEYVDYMHRGLDVFRSYIKAWYDGPLQTIFFYSGFREEMKKQITSVLAGYAWDESNSFVKNHARVLSTLEKVILIEERKKK